MKTRRASESSLPMTKVGSGSGSGTKTTNTPAFAQPVAPRTGYAPFVLLLAVTLAALCCRLEGHDEIVATTVGLQGKTVQTLAIDPNNPSILYAGTVLYGVYKSVDAGATWNQVSSGMTDSNVVSLVVDPSATTTLYAATSSGGVFRSHDSASSWDAVNTGLTSLYIGSLIIDPVDTSTLYAGTSGGVFKTFNKGDIWSPRNSGFSSEDSVQALVINPSNTQDIYAGMYSTGVYRSTNGGTTWTEANNGLDNLWIRALCIDPVLTSTVYAGTDQLPLNSGEPIRGTVYKSTDSGASWTKKPPDWGAGILAVELDPNDHNRVFAGTWPDGAALSRDGGATWIISYRDASLLMEVYDFVVHPVSSAVYAGTSNGVMKLTEEKLAFN